MSMQMGDEGARRRRARALLLGHGLVPVRTGHESNMKSVQMCEKSAQMCEPSSGKEAEHTGTPADLSAAAALSQYLQGTTREESVQIWLSN